MIPSPPLPCSFPPVVNMPTLHQSLSHHCPAHPPHPYSHTLDLWPLPCPPALSDRGTLLPHPPPSVGHREVIVRLPSTSAHSQQYRLQDKWVVFNWKVEWPCWGFFWLNGEQCLLQNSRRSLHNPREGQPHIRRLNLKGGGLKFWLSSKCEYT